jgi:LmbE family N-acetylglucosaminyl deacetylase
VAFPGIMDSLASGGPRFTVINVTDGAGGIRAGEYANVGPTVVLLRQEEEKRCAELGKYASAVLLSWPSKAVKKYNKALVQELIEILRFCRPRRIFTHSVLDFHETHLAVTYHVVQALRVLRERDGWEFPVWGAEVWGGLSFLPPNFPDRESFDVSDGLDLAQQLLGAYPSQLASHDYRQCVQRWVSNACFENSHKETQKRAAFFVLNLLPLIQNPKLTLRQFVTDIVVRAFENRRFDLQ